jgi:hypothetical protein
MAQLFDVLFTDLRSSKKHMNRLLTLGILFILVGHFYVVEPYFQYKVQESVLSIQRDNLKALSQDIESTLRDTKDQIENYPNHLGEMRRKIYDALWLGPSSDPLQVGEISLPAQITFEKGMRLYVEKWFTNLIDQLEKGIVTEVSNLSTTANKAIEDFRAGLNKLEKDNPDIWRNYEVKKGEVATGQLQDLVEVSFDSLENELFGLMKITGENLKKVDDN